MSVRWRFGDCVLDGESRELLRQGSPVPLSPKAFHLLELLLEKRPKALSKDELKDALWPDTFVVETNLANLAAEVREAIGEKGERDGRLRTVHGFGYAFSGEAVEEDARRRLPPREASAPSSATDTAFRSTKARTFSGATRRPTSSSTTTRSPAVTRGSSWRPARRSFRTSGARTERISGAAASRRPPTLKDRDEILVGSVLLVFSAPDPDRPTATRTDRPLPGS